MNEFFNVGSLIIQFVNVIVIIYLLNRFLFKPYLKYLDKEVDARQELEDKLGNIDGILKNAEDEADTIVNDAKEKASTIRNDAILLWKNESEAIKNNAKLEAEKIKNKWLLDVEEQRKNLHSELKDEATALVIKLNQKMFDKTNINEDFISKSMAR